MDNPYETGNEDQDDEQGTQGFEASKELLVFLIDAHPDMLQKANLKDNRGHPDATYLDVAVYQAADVLKTRIIASSNDEIAVVFYGTREKEKPNSFDNIYTFLDLDVPDASRIRSLKSLNAEKFEKEIGSHQGDNVDPAAHLKMALWKCSQLFMNGSAKASKRILLFTNCEDPCHGSLRSKTYKDQILDRARDLHDSGVTLQLFPIIAAQHPFDINAFWSDIIEVLRDENDGVGPLNVVAQMGDLIETIKRRTYKKRPLRMVYWTLGPGIELAVQMFNLIQPATKGAVVWLDAKTNEPLRSETAYICSDTGAILTSVDKKCYEIKSGDKLRFPKVVMLNQEVNQVKSVKPLGMKLLGFKPRSCLQDYHQIRAAHFIYPAEHRVKGSTRLFFSLLLSMHHHDQIAVCSYVSRADAMPVLVALVPQLELQQDGTQMQVEPPGMHMMYLPFADDIRYPETDPNLVGVSAQRADESQVAAAEALVDTLTLDPLFNTANEIFNPHIQRHYSVLEAVALEEPIPAMVDDETLPDPEGMTREDVSSAIQQFKNAVFTTVVEGKGTKAGAKGTKRKAEDEAAAEYGQYNWKKLSASNALEKLKVDELKLYLQHHRLNLSGRKADLVERIRTHANKAKT